jgi:ArsR family transcriptional regulator, arsenate/arsenite/antimonite-responsive transcriptional repressor
MMIQKEVKFMVDIFKALAEESRLRILTLLMQDEMCVCEIEECLKMTQSNVSRHLTALKNSGILDSNKKAQWTYYKISDNFKEENEKLWLYLLKKLKELPNYQADLDEYQKCKEQDICNVNKSC